MKKQHRHALHRRPRAVSPMHFHTLTALWGRARTSQVSERFYDRSRQLWDLPGCLSSHNEARRHIFAASRNPALCP